MQYYYQNDDNFSDDPSSHRADSKIQKYDEVGFNEIPLSPMQLDESVDFSEEEAQMERKEQVVKHEISEEGRKHLKKCFFNMMSEYDFFSVVIYPDLKARKQFVHDAWEIAKFTECYELKLIIS